MKGSPKKRYDITSDGASSSSGSALRNIGGRVRDKVSKKVFGPSKHFVPSKEKRGRPPDLFLFDSVKSLYKYAIKNSVMKADPDLESDAERALLSERQMFRNVNGGSVDITSQCTLLTPPVDPFWRPHELDRVSPQLADDMTTDPSVPEITNWMIYLSEYLPEQDSICKEKEINGQTLSTTRNADVVEEDCIDSSLHVSIF